MYRLMMPRFDPGMKTGRIVEWLKKEGDPVAKGEPVVVVEGEKTTFEMEAPVEGILRKIEYQAGSEVQVSEVIALIGEAGEPLELEAVALAKPSEKAPEELKAEVMKEVRASPRAKLLARERGIDLTTITGTGPGGRITEDDVLAVIERRKTMAAEAVVQQEPAVAKARAARVAKVFPLLGIRKTIAERLSYSSRTAAPAMISMEVHMEELLKLREALQESSKTRISLTAFLVKAAAKALEAHPALNSALDEDKVKLFEDINVAVAIDTPQGLVAPVVPEANRKSVLEISRAIGNFAERAEQGRLKLEELTGGTFTVTNLGGYSVDTFIPIINPPNCAILGIGRVAKRAAVVGERVEARPLANLTLVFDHRIVDGAPAARFLESIKQLLEGPSSIIL